MTTTLTHPGELTLRRALAEERLDAAVTEHLRSCAECGARLEKLRDEQRAFEAEIPFERFAAGVEKAARLQQRAARPTRWLNVAIAVAAVFLAVVGAQVVRDGEATSRVKGGADVEFVVAGAAGQRPARELEPLAPGDRIRIGVTGTHRYVLAVSIDERGEVSPVYDEVVEGGGVVWLPESIEFTGTGREHLVVVLSDLRLSTGEVSVLLQEKFREAQGELSQLGALDVPGVQVHRTFIKP